LLPKPVDLHTRFQASENRRRLLLSIVTRRYFDDSDADSSSSTLSAGFSERIMSASPTGAMVSLFYQGVDRSTGNKEARPDRILQTARANLKIMKAWVELDASGNVKTNQFVAAQPVPGEDTLRQVHETFRVGLNSSYLPLPNRTVKSKETWKTTLPPTAPARATQVELTCTYLGTRSKAGREEAVVALSGQIGTGATAGKAHGEMIVDVASGTIRSVELDATTNLPDLTIASGGKSRKFKIRSTVAIRVQRDR
jgi:hypothetical protein